MSVINTNITALIGQNNLSNSQSMLAKAQERLSSGLRINSASDDAAGQAIANKMSAQIRGMDQASRNASDGISLVQTMEGGLDQINDNLQRIRELAVQGANDTNATEDRDAIVTEINERLAEIDRVAGSNNFNGT
ncbi:flagellin FliC, partial [Vreelandella titanicae]